MSVSLTVNETTRAVSVTVSNERGPIGATGETGPAGPTGATGATGATGPAGSDATVTAANTLTALEAMTAAQEKSSRDAIAAVGIDLGAADVINSQPNVFKKFAASSAPVRLAFMGDSLMALGFPGIGPRMSEVGRFGNGVSVGTTLNSFDNWVTGKATSLGIGQTGEFTCGYASATPIQGSRFTLYYIKESGAGIFELEYQANGTGAWVPLGVGTGKIFTADSGTDAITSTAHGFNTGTGIRLTVTSGTLPTAASGGNLVIDTNYYVIRIDANTYKLARTYALSQTSTAIDLTSNGSGTMTAFPYAGLAIDASNASAIGAVFTAELSTTSSPSYKVRITNVSVGAVKIIGAGIYYHEGNGVILYGGSLLYEGGVDFPNPLVTPDAILTPILQDMDLDCVLSCWADDGAEWDAGGDFDLYFDKFQAAYSGTDWIQMSAHPLTIATAASEQLGFEKQRDWALRNNQTFINCWDIFKGDAQWMADNGLKSTADDPHLTTAGGMVRAAHLWSRLPLGQYGLGAVGRDMVSGTPYPLIQIQGGDATPLDAPLLFNRPLIVKGGSSGAITLLDRADQYNQAKAGFFYTTGSETYIGTSGTVCMILGTSSFSGVHPSFDNAMLGGRGDLRWRGAFGGITVGYRAVTGNTTFVTDDHTINVTANSPTITLPAATAVSASTGSANNAAAGIEGKIFIIANTGAGTVTVATTSSQTIDGSAPGTVAAGARLRVQSTGTNWITI